MRWLVLITVLVLAGLTAFAQYDLPCNAGPRAPLGYSLVSSNSISIVWPTNNLRTELRIGRRIYTNNPNYWNAWTWLTTNKNPATVKQASQYDDTNIVGTHFEYVLATLSTNWNCVTDAQYGNGVGYASGAGNTNLPAWAYQYINTGYQVPVRDSLGGLILLVESNLVTTIEADIAILTNDLIGDGYKVYRHNVYADEVTNASWFTSVTNIKTLIATDYNTAPSADWTIFILGHVPIPYSGDSSPGSHANNVGAHPADWYYADTNSTHWTDSTVNDSTADFVSQRNVPGDNKFDQNTVQGIPQMRVGRVDLTNMPAFSKTYAQLVQQYLQRDHAWRTKQTTVRDRGLVKTNGYPFESYSLWSSMFGSTTNADSGVWLTDATNAANSYLFAASKAFGDYDHDGGVGYTTNFAAAPLYAVFCTEYGSYFGDWDSGQHSNDVAQAALADAGYALTMEYRENVVNVDMFSMGEPIGQELYSINNTPDFSKRYVQYGYYSGGEFVVTQIPNNYVSLMGDPTLRVRPVAPPTNVFVASDAPDRIISWTGSTDSNIQGYHVYRAPTTNLNMVTRLTAIPTNSPYRDASPPTGTNYTWWVRAVKLEQSTNRSYFNPSEAAFSTSTIYTNYYVSTNAGASDSNPGTSALPFLTVQKGFNVARAGDKVFLTQGVYNEWVTTQRAGSSGLPITLDGQGVGTISNLLILNQYLTIQNCIFTGPTNGYLVFLGKGGNNASHCILSNNVFDGNYLYSTTYTTNYTYSTNGQPATTCWSCCTNDGPITTNIASINTNHPCTMLMKFDNPSGADLPFGGTCASYCLIVSNTFERGIGTVNVSMFGDTNVCYGNVFRDGDAVDWIQPWGRSNSIVANVFSNSFVSGLVGNHPDLIQFHGLNGQGCSGLVVESNLFIKGACQIAMLEGDDCANCFTNITFRNNLYVNIAYGAPIALPNVAFYNNTFVDCATNAGGDGVPDNPGGRQVLAFTTAEWVGTINSPPGTRTNYSQSTGTGGRAFNNVFYNCGGTNSGTGWYAVDPDMTNATWPEIMVDYNFVCKSNSQGVFVDPAHRNPGNATLSWSKFNWWEPHGINGGNPSLGADYHPLTNSILIGAATNLNAFFLTDAAGVTRGSAWDIGAYQFQGGSNPPAPPSGNTFSAGTIRAGRVSKP